MLESLCTAPPHLSVCDGNDVGWDVGRHITGLGLNDGEGGQRSTPEVVVHLGGTLKQTGVEVEHITGVGLTTRGTTQQQRHLTVGNSLQGRKTSTLRTTASQTPDTITVLADRDLNPLLESMHTHSNNPANLSIPSHPTMTFHSRNANTHLLGQVIIDDQGVFAVVSEVFTHGAAGVGGQVLQGGSIGGSGRHHNGVLHGIGVSQTLDQLGHGGTLLADGHIDAVQLLLLVCSIVEALLVDDCVNGNGGFAGGHNIPQL